ncbi:RidA family protein [Klebsiella oxytoca]
MITRSDTHCNDATCPACVIAGDFIFLSHHAGGHDSTDVIHQVRATLSALTKTLHLENADLKDIVQITLYLKKKSDFPLARAVFSEYFTEGLYPARMTVITDFINESCLCMVDGIAYRCNQ